MLVACPFIPASPHTSNSNPHSLFLPILAFFSFLNRHSQFLSLGLHLLFPSALTALAPEISKVCSFCLSKSQIKCHLVREVFHGHSIRQCTSLLKHIFHLGSRSHYLAFLCFKSTALLLFEFPPLCVYFLASPQNISFMRTRMHPSYL